MKTIIFIPVRRGSKGIPGKNARILGDRPLICWIVDAALEADIADSIWIATDCDQMESLLKRRYGNSVEIFRRSEWSARDESPTIEVVQEFITSCHPDLNDHFILLQATSPFTTSGELRTLANEMKLKKYHSFIACCRLKKFRWSDDGFPLDYAHNNKPRRQDYKGFLIETGAFYASTVKYILITGQLVSGNVKAMEINSAGMIDIDEEDDWKMGEYFAKTHLYGSKYDGGTE